MNLKSIVHQAVVLAASAAFVLSACDQQSATPKGPSQPAARTPNKSDVASTGAGGEAAPSFTPPERQQTPGAGGPAPTGPRSVAVPRDPPASSTPPAAADSGSPTEAQFAGLSAPKPATWQYRAPPATSTMRVAEYLVPGVEGSDQAQIIVYQFPGGGSFDDNVQRWKGQFKHDDGSPIEAKTQEVDASGIKIGVAEITGDYRGMGMTEHAKDNMLIAAMIEGEGNPVFLQLVGPRKTVEANREAYLTMLRGIKRVEPMK